MIDVNRQKFRILSGAKHFHLNDPDHVVEWNESLQVLRLRSTRTLENMPVDRKKAKILADQSTVTLDAFGTWAKVDETGRIILAGGVLPDPNPIYSLPDGEKLVDMAMNPDGVLYLISKDDQGVSILHLINRRGSKEEGKSVYLDDDDTPYDMNVVKFFFSEGESRPDRVVAISHGGALLLDRKNGKFWQVIGKPLRKQPVPRYLPRTPRPCSDGPKTQELIERNDLILPPEFEAVDMASNPKGETAVLLYPFQPDNSAAVALISDKGMSPPLFFDSAYAPYSIGWVKDDDWALLFIDKKEAFVYSVICPEFTLDKPVRVSGRRFPLNWGINGVWKNARFCNGLSQPVYYPSTDNRQHFLVRPLYPLSFPSYAVRAEIEAVQIIDSGEPNTIWHRMYLEAHLPKGTGVIVHLAAGEDKDALQNNPQWAKHHFGTVKAGPDIPKGVWINDTSEVPFFPGLLYCSPRRDTAGIFGVLVQRPGYAVRSLKGRYLNVKIELMGGGHATPEIAALRIYYPRFSYLDQYLPELYRETNVRQKADEEGKAGGSDFMRRFLCLFESVLTPLEDKVAAVYMLTNPTSAPPEALDWLGRWIGLAENSGFSEKQKRLYIKHATDLYRKRGTMKGLALALDLITGNMVSRGDIVLFEDFRLRRTFATILGADLSVENDPLLMADLPSSNSFVGETLFLGEEEKKEFLALYLPEISSDNDEEEIIDNFYARLANRLTVLVYRHTDNETLGLIRRVVSMETPSHIDFRVVSASKPLLIGMYSLVGIDTYMQKEPERRTARIGRSYLGRYDFIRNLPVLDDRLEP
jgi:phage tail-like protein